MNAFAIYKLPHDRMATLIGAVGLVSRSSQGAAGRQKVTPEASRVMVQTFSKHKIGTGFLFHFQA